LSKNKETAVIIAFFSEAQFTLTVLSLPLALTVISASQVDVFWEEFGFYLTIKGFINHERRRFGASLKKIR